MRVLPSTLRLIIPLLLAGGCKSPAPVTRWTPEASPAEWVWEKVVQNDGREIRPLAGADFHLLLAGEQVSGKSGCNRFNGRIQAFGDSVLMGPLAVSRMACMEPEGLMAQEQFFLNQLQLPAKFLQKGAQLVVQNRAGVLYFSPK